MQSQLDQREVQTAKGLCLLLNMYELNARLTNIVC